MYRSNIKMSIKVDVLIKTGRKDMGMINGIIDTRC
nr:MAG TPA: hypothetical protein [Microviridae sp.]